MRELPPVPDCEGPQLQPYQSSGTPEITFLEKVGNGIHGHVFKVQIDNKIFALKVFNYQLLDSTWITMDEEEGDKVDIKLLTAQWHPFNAECRAYARLKETEKEHLAVRCYGYVRLTEGQKKELEDRFGISSWWSDDYNLETTNPEYQQEFQQESRRCLRAIVKDFIESSEPYGPEHAPMMISDLNQLHRIGIVVHDLKDDAYVAGKLVDFSKAVVVPHIMFDPGLWGNPNYTAQSEVYEDLARLYDHFREWNEEHQEGPKIECDLWEIDVAVSRLRRGPLTWKEYIERSFNPRKIKWRKFSPRSGDSKATRHATNKVSGSTGKKAAGVTKRKAPTRKRKAKR